MTDSPTISVIIPVYNVEPYLEECLQSVAAQTFRDFEAIVVDDGSTDGSGAIAEKFAAQDARFQVVHQQNKGISATRNTGLDLAKAEFVVFVDSDDRCKPAMFETLLNAAQRDGADMAMCNYARLQGGKAVNVRVFSPSIPPVLDEYGYWQVDDMGLVNCVLWNKIYRRSLFDGIRFKEGRCHEDLEVEHRIVSRCSKISVVKDRLYEYRQREGSITTLPQTGRFFDVCDALVERGEYFERRGWWDYYQDNAQHLVSRVARLSGSCRQMDAAEKELYRTYARQARRMAFKAMRRAKASKGFVLRIVAFLVHPRLYNAIVRLKMRLAARCKTEG